MWLPSFSWYRLPETKLTLTKLIIKQWSPKNGTHLALANTKVTLASPPRNKPIQSQRSKHWCCRPSAQSSIQISPAPPYRILPSPSSIQRCPGSPAHSHLRTALSWDRKGRRAQRQEKMWKLGRWGRKPGVYWKRLCRKGRGRLLSFHRVLVLPL